MAASETTVHQIVDILEEEIPYTEARLRLATRLLKETKGNRSYNETVKMLYRTIADRDRVLKPRKSKGGINNGPADAE